VVVGPVVIGLLGVIVVDGILDNVSRVIRFRAVG